MRPFSTDGLLDIRTFSDFLLGESAAQNGSPTGSSNVSLSNGSSGLFRKDERYIDFAGVRAGRLQAVESRDAERRLALRSLRRAIGHQRQTRHIRPNHRHQSLRQLRER